MTYFLLFLLILTSSSPPPLYRRSEFSLASSETQKWYMQRNEEVSKAVGFGGIGPETEIGRSLSSSSGLSDKDWIPATVPGTVLTSLLVNGAVKNITDPYYEDNLRSFPDMSEKGRDYYTYWFRTTLSADDLLCNGNGRLFLYLRGISYFASVFFNGHALQTVEGDDPPVKGQFLRHLFDLTDLIDASQKPKGYILAILIRPVTFPGNPGGQGGDHQIARNAATSQYVTGWDWVNPTPDRNSGIWDKISLWKTSDSIFLRHPRIRATDIDSQSSTLKVEATVCNRDSKVDHVGEVRYRIDKTLEVSQEYNVKAGECVLVNFKDEKIMNPKLWWPFGYGEQYLYPLDMEAWVKGGVGGSLILSDEISERFGIRDLRWEISGAGQNGYKFFINQQPIFIRGGNWIATDQLLRYSTNPTVYRHHIRMHQDMGLNMIRIWGGGLTERPEFYQACDELGILVLQDFWMTGDCNGRYAGQTSWPDDHELYLRSAEDTVYMLRNHPSLIIWTGGNELIDTVTPDIFKQLTKWLQSPGGELDDTRLYVQSTLGEDPSHGLAPEDGPYGLLEPRSWFQKSPKHQRFVSFNPETGSVSIPVLESCRRFFSEATLNEFPGKDLRPDPPSPPSTISYLMVSQMGNPEKNLKKQPQPQPPLQLTETRSAAQIRAAAMWEYHLFEDFKDENEFDQIEQYGHPETVADFIFQAQLVTYTQYRALIEGHTSHMWDYYTGVLIWKTQGPWTELRGHLYDYYLDQTGGFFGVKKSTEMVHIQLNLVGSSEWKVGVVNQHNHVMGPYLACVDFYTLEGAPIDSQRVIPVPSLPPSSALEPVGGDLSWPISLTDPLDLVFIKLTLLEEGTKKLISENFYWQKNPTLQPTKDQFISLQRLKKGKTHLRLQGKFTTAASSSPSSQSLLFPQLHQLSSSSLHSHSHRSHSRRARSLLTRDENQRMEGEEEILGNQDKGKREREAEAEEKEERLVVELENPNTELAFFLRLSLLCPPHTGSSDERILPTWYEDNYFSLLPGEHKSVHVSYYPSSISSSGPLRVQVTGWNVEPLLLTLSHSNSS